MLQPKPLYAVSLISSRTSAREQARQEAARVWERRLSEGRLCERAEAEAKKEHLQDSWCTRRARHTLRSTCLLTSLVARHLFPTRVGISPPFAPRCTSVAPHCTSVAPLTRAGISPPVAPRCTSVAPRCTSVAPLTRAGISPYRGLSYWCMS